MVHVEDWFEWVRKEGIGSGQADFDRRIENLEPIDLARLYAYVNQKNHVLELVLAFSALLGKSLSLDGSAVIDVGCGPFTAGLALANVVGKSQSFDYYGVDLAQSMCDFGSELAQAVRAADALHENTNVQFLRDMNTICQGGVRRGQLTLVVLSYLLASTSLDVEKMTCEVIAACDRISMGAVYLLYTNSSHDWADRNYKPFEKLLEQAGFTLVDGGKETLTEISDTRKVHYALFRRQPITRLSKEFFK
jgi:SAM-dependent methyltransferase